MIFNTYKGGSYKLVDPLRLRVVARFRWHITEKGVWLGFRTHLPHRVMK